MKSLNEYEQKLLKVQIQPKNPQTFLQKSNQVKWCPTHVTKCCDSQINAVILWSIFVVTARPLICGGGFPSFTKTTALISHWRAQILRLDTFGIHFVGATFQCWVSLKESICLERINTYWQSWWWWGKTSPLLRGRWWPSVSASASHEGWWGCRTLWAP